MNDTIKNNKRMNDTVYNNEYLNTLFVLPSVYFSSVFLLLSKFLFSNETVNEGTLV